MSSPDKYDSLHRVAFDLMLKIAGDDNSSKNRAYYFKLYRQCRTTVSGATSAAEMKVGSKGRYPA